MRVAEGPTPPPRQTRIRAVSPHTHARGPPGSFARTRKPRRQSGRRGSRPPPDLRRAPARMRAAPAGRRSTPDIAETNRRDRQYLSCCWSLWVALVVWLLSIAPRWPRAPGTRSTSRHAVLQAVVDAIAVSIGLSSREQYVVLPGRASRNKEPHTGIRRPHPPSEVHRQEPGRSRSDPALSTRSGLRVIRLAASAG